MRRGRFLAALLVGLAGCRAVLGIESTELVEDAGAPDGTTMDAHIPPDAAGDEGSADTSTRHDTASQGQDSASPEDTDEERGPEDAQGDGASHLDSAADAEEASADSGSAHDAATEAAAEAAADSAIADAHDSAVQPQDTGAAHDSTVQPQDTGSAPDSAASQDSGTTGLDFDAAAYAMCVSAGATNCPGCCVNSYMSGYGELLMYGQSVNCVCTAQTCASACAGTSVCLDTPPSGPLVGACGLCLFMALTSSACAGATSLCAMDTTCQPALQCIEACP